MTTPGVDLRSYAAGDQADVEAFFEEVWRGGRFRFDPIDSHADLRKIAEVYQTGGGDFWLLWAGERLVGTVALKRLSDDVAEVKRLNVHPEFRGLGYGDLLLRRSLEQASAKGFGAVRLDTLRLPGPAVHLFEKHGFSEIDRYNSNPDADLFMELELGGGRATHVR